MKVLFKPDGPNPHTELALIAGFLLPELLKMEGFPRSSEMGSCNGALLFTRRKNASYGWDFKFSEKATTLCLALPFVHFPATGDVWPLAVVYVSAS
ncbi:hypothetical protein F2Q70_00016411 [Brassica cretica]|nr:hypothetical protein F2Q70_00016411 [Brassica cretica]